MKINSTLTLAAIAACFTLAGCDKKPATGAADSNAAPANAAPAVTSEKTALANFKTQIDQVGTWIEEKQKSPVADPTAGMAMMGEVIGKLKAIKTDGLPADLKGAWNDMGGVLTEMGDVFKGMPKIDASKPEEMTKAMGDFMPKMMAIQAKVEPVAKKLQEVASKYDLDMSKVAPGK